MINHRQKLALEILWCQHKHLIIANASRFGIQPAILIALCGAYAMLTVNGYYNSGTYWYDKGWASDLVTPEKARYGFTQIRLSVAQNLKLSSNVTRRVLTTPSKCFMITARILSEVDYMQPMEMLQYWHGKLDELPESVKFRFKGSLTYFSRSMTLEDTIQLGPKPATAGRVVDDS